MYRLLILGLIFTSAPLLSLEWDGKEYSQNSSVQLSHAEIMLKNINLNGDEKVLDIGCGDGKITALLAQRVPNGTVIGIDPSPSMLTKACELQKENAFPNLKFYQDSVEKFSFKEKFDHITAIHVMHWLEKQETALKNIYDHLKPGGQIHFILAPSKEGLPFHQALEKTVLEWDENFKEFVNPQKAFDMETYRKLVVDAGFHIRAIHYVYHESIHENREKLKLWIKQWLPHHKHLPECKQIAFLDELMDNYMGEAGDPVCWGEYVLIVEATRPMSSY